ncbi:MAG: isochorismatase family protein [Porphyromonadaceae bacterium]|nr:isochorismatase family protein [Porphyromonadaceae bacterium]
MKRVLLIVDPQIDFITGTLPVPEAAEAMERLALWIREHSNLYDAIVITMDQHPYNHCSFVAHGGIWPPHCVRYTEGAAIYPAIHEQTVLAALSGKPLLYIEKATTTERDAYSAFAEDTPRLLLDAEKIYLAGLAGDYCVAETHRDLLKNIPSERIELLHEGIAYINKPE